MKNKHVVASVGPVLICILSAVPVFAQTQVIGTAGTHLTYPDAALNPTAEDDRQSFDNVGLPAANIPATVTSTVPPQSGASANATVTASEGVFHGHASATHPDTGDSYYAEAVVSASAGDRITLAPLLAPGTPVLVNYSLVLSGSVTQAACGQGCGGSFEAVADATFSVNPVSGSGPGLNLHFDTATTNNVLSGVLEGLAGAQVDVGQTFNLMAYVNGIHYLGDHPETATADFSNTVHFYADALTPGATLLADSGHDYSSVAAVPEPKNYAMLVTGLGLLGWVGRRHRKHQTTC